MLSLIKSSPPGRPTQGTDELKPSGQQPREGGKLKAVLLCWQGEGKGRDTGRGIVLCWEA